MPISVRERGDISIVQLKGVFTLGMVGPLPPRGVRTAPLSGLGETLGQLHDEGRRKILLDLSEITDFDSAGLGELVACMRRTQQQGGEIRLMRPAEKMRGVLEMLYLTRIFRVYDDESAALSSFDA